MKNYSDLDSYQKETEKIIENFNQINIKSKKLQDEVTNSITTKKERFEEKRKLKNKEFNFLRNK